MAPPKKTSIRYQILGMSKAGKRPDEISEALGVHLSTIYRTLNHAKERNDDLETKTGAGRKASTVTRRNIDAVRKRIQRNPTKPIRELSRDMRIPYTSMIRLVTAAGFKSMTRLVVHELMPGQQERRLDRAKGLIAGRKTGQNKFREIAWTDEEAFVLQQHINRRNDRVLMPIACYDPSISLVKRRKQPQSVMVFGAVVSNGAMMPPIIIPPKVTITSMSYQELVLPKLKTWLEQQFGPPSDFMGTEGMSRIVLMQDGAPAHTSKSTQAWLVSNLGRDNVWGREQWPPSSPDCNPMDFSLWAALAKAVTAQGVPKNRTELITRLEEVWPQVLEPSYVKNCCRAAWDRLQRVVDAHGGYIERIRTVANVNEDVEDKNNNVPT